MKKLFIALSLFALTANAQTGFLAGMGISYGNKSITGDLVLGLKTNKISVAYNQIAFLDAGLPAYFGGMAGYDLLHTDTYHITATAGYYYRKQTSDADGKAAGNYSVYGFGLNFNKEWFSITTRYIDKQFQVGIMASGLLSRE